MNFYAELDYAQLIRKAVESRKELDRAFTFQSLAERMRVQKSYLSKVLAGSAHLSTDQLYLACEALGFDEDQRAYALLLLEHARTGVKARRERLREEIERRRARHLHSEAHLDKRVVRADSERWMEYYLDPALQIVHVALTVPRYRHDLVSLAADLGFRPARLATALATLERIGIVARQRGGAWTPVVEDLHLPRESKLYASWRRQLRTLALHRLDEAGDDREAYSFSVVFSADPDTRARIHARFLEYLKEVEKLVKRADPERVYQMSFDLFPWTSRP